MHNLSSQTIQQIEQTIPRCFLIFSRYNNSLNKANSWHPKHKNTTFTIVHPNQAGFIPRCDIYLLDIKARNDAIDLMWLKRYLDLSLKCHQWAYADEFLHFWHLSLMLRPHPSHHRRHSLTPSRCHPHRSYKSLLTHFTMHDAVMRCHAPILFGTCHMKNIPSRRRH